MEEKMTKTEIARQKRESRMRAEMERVEKMRSFERDAVRAAGGSGPVCGIDEAGRGPLAGPVAAAAVILPEDLALPWLNDSKKVTEKRREVLYRQITEKAVSWAVVMVPPERIDEINILQATYEAMRSAVSRLSVRPGVLVNDAVTIPDVDILQVPVIKGDARCISVAAASILAKVTRDAYMKEMDLKYPVYGFAGHKGYGTKTHCSAILEHGPCPIHRRSFLGRLLAGSAWDLHDLREAADHPSSRDTGRIGEDQAVRFLEKKGVRILERNFRARQGEIDIVASQEGVIVFAEVKYRKNLRFGDPAEAVGPEKQKNICEAALYYLHRRGYSTQTPVRFDVLAVTGEGIRWIKDAFPFPADGQL